MRPSVPSYPQERQRHRAMGLVTMAPMPGAKASLNSCSRRTARGVEIRVTRRAKEIRGTQETEQNKMRHREGVPGKVYISREAAPRTHKGGTKVILFFSDSHLEFRSFAHGGPLHWEALSEVARSDWAGCFVARANIFLTLHCTRICLDWLGIGVLHLLWRGGRVRGNHSKTQREVENVEDQKNHGSNRRLDRGECCVYYYLGEQRTGVNNHTYYYSLVSRRAGRESSSEMP